MFLVGCWAWGKRKKIEKCIVSTYNKERPKKTEQRQNKVAEQKVDMEYFSLHGCAHHQLRVDRSTRPVEKNI